MKLRLGVYLLGTVSLALLSAPTVSSVVRLALWTVAAPAVVALLVAQHPGSNLRRRIVIWGMPLALFSGVALHQNLVIAAGRWAVIYAEAGGRTVAFANPNWRPQMFFYSGVSRSPVESSRSAYLGTVTVSHRAQGRAVSVSAKFRPERLQDFRASDLARDRDSARKSISAAIVEAGADESLLRSCLERDGFQVLTLQVR